MMPGTEDQDEEIQSLNVEEPTLSEHEQILDTDSSPTNSANIDTQHQDVHNITTTTNSITLTSTEKTASPPSVLPNV